ncbi:MAG: flagellar protein FlgN [Pseudomonadales bacterium]|nr:flagellar protein FlgN [Pseudomonadales bacterium]
METESVHAQEIKQVSEQLNTGIKLFQSLKAALENERHNLENRDYDSFQADAVEKESCLESISQHEDTFNHLLETLHIDLGDKTIDRLIERYSPSKDTSFSEDAKLYRARLSECDDLNTINGRIIQRSQVNANQLLNLIKGAVKQNETYTRSGKTKSNGGTHPIAKA